MCSSDLSGSAVATFTIGVNRVYKTQSGEKKEQASFIRIVVWGRRAEVCGEYLSKGSPVFVEGRLQSRDWQTQDGQKRNTVEVIADNVQFLRMGDKQGAGRKAPPEDIETINLGEESGILPDEKPPSAPASNSEEVPF